MGSTPTTGRVPACDRSAREVLAWSRDLVDPALRDAVATLPASMRRVVGYHFGWCDEHGRPGRAPAGKALRPALALLSAQAAGGMAEDAVPAAVAVELVHNFSLLHDDVMDRDTTRRHRPTAWTVFGSGPAILAGDALLTLALDVLAATAHPEARRCVRTLSAAVQSLVGGQSADVSFEQRTDVDLAECLAMAEQKTAALLGCCCELGAVLGGGDADRVRRMRGFGEQVGLAFQHVDDLLGIWGRPEVTGKPAHSDLANRKKSLPVVAALTSATRAGRDLAELYRRDGELSGDDLAHAAELVETAGGRAWSRGQADLLLTEALGLLYGADPPEAPATELAALARLATRRDH
ncbi:geranylgeranyl diphosphate synthase type I [Nocardiopsis mwathae]|uniref:Geranylgeranyl diphosphate synthase type I n=1 Tax=Nocardiopsis mwathae TaxID=1472723 RepID=A0A7W9YF06_9ACTN|nr:family 2 encapsulin nanocompartment cargo protein polyprenyl transferase [Nocardiopsis mwathae]MBB6170968.1 geranylgeranyl diphosphate synthase type I [Nocardiopsis mwathae]